MSICPHCVIDCSDADMRFYVLTRPVTARGLTSLGTAACPDCRPLLESGRAGDLARRAPADVTRLLTDAEVGDLVGVLAAICDRIGPPMDRADFDARIQPLLAVGRPLGIPTIELTTEETECQANP